jgi:type II secretory pathway component PulF
MRIDTILAASDVATASSHSASSATSRERTPNRRVVTDFTIALGALLTAGLPIAQAIATAATSASFSPSIARDLTTHIARGEAIATALARYPRLFSAAYIGLVRVGERTGNLAGTFQRLGTQLERDEQLRARALSAAIYPMILAFAGVVSLVVLIFFVLPRFAELLASNDAELPASTAMLLGASRLARDAWYVLPVLAAATLLGAVWATTSEQGRLAWSRLLLALPVVNDLRRQSLAARIARLTGSLLEGGASMLNALDDAAASLGDPVGRMELARIRARVREGASLAITIREGALLPPLFAQLVAVGEGAGRVPEFLLRAADLFDERVDRSRQRLLMFAEPAMIVAFGGVIGFVALALLQAVYGLSAGSLS